MNRESFTVGYPVRSVYSGRLGSVVRITEHGCEVKFLGYGGIRFLRFNDLCPEPEPRRRKRKS
jgi:hypothetical protein